MQMGQKVDQLRKCTCKIELQLLYLYFVHFVDTTVQHTKSKKAIWVTSGSQEQRNLPMQKHAVHSMPGVVEKSR